MIEQVLARLDTDVASLRRRGFGEEADRLAAVVGEVREAIGPLKLVPEHVAMLRSGRSARWLRERHGEWERVGAAGFDLAGNRMYRLCVLPTRLARAEAIADADRLMEAS
jgi:hypothetical protein